MPIYEVEVTLSVLTFADDEKGAASKGRSLVEAGCGRMVDARVVKVERQQEQSGPRESTAG